MFLIYLDYLSLLFRDRKDSFQSLQNYLKSNFNSSYVTVFYRIRSLLFLILLTHQIFESYTAQRYQSQNVNFLQVPLNFRLSFLNELHKLYGLERFQNRNIEWIHSLFLLVFESNDPIEQIYDFLIDFYENENNFTYGLAILKLLYETVNSRNVFPRKFYLDDYQNFIDHLNEDIPHYQVFYQSLISHSSPVPPNDYFLNNSYFDSDDDLSDGFNI